MQAYILPSGKWLVPKRAEHEGVIGDGMDVVEASDPEALAWAGWYESRREEPPVREEDEDADRRP